VRTQRRIAVFALLGAFCTVATVVFVNRHDDDYVVKAEFKDVGGLRKNSSVKVAGVPGGKVIELVVDKRPTGDVAVATLRMKKSAAPIGSGARIEVRPTDLLGERYAELLPGDRSRPVRSGSTIPTSRTSVPVELDDIFNILDPDTRTRLGILLNEVGMGLHGRGFDLNKLLAEMPPSLEQTRALLAQVADQNRTLKAMLVKGDRITATIDAKHDYLGELIDEAQSALGGVAAKRESLGRTIQHAPGAFAQLRSTLANLDSASVALRPFADDLRRTAPALGTTLRSLPEFADAAAPTLRTARQVSPSLSSLGSRATPTIRRLRPTSAALAGVLREAGPIVDQLDLRATDDILYFIQNWALGMKPRDALGHQVSAKINIDSSYVTSALAALTPTKEPTSKRAPAKRKLVPKLPLGEDAPKPPAVKDVPSKLKDALPKVIKPVTDAVDALPQIVDGVLGGVLRPQGKGADPAHGQDTDALSLFDYMMGP